MLNLDNISLRKLTFFLGYITTMFPDMFWTTSTPVRVELSSRWSGLPQKFFTTVNTAASRTSGPTVRRHAPSTGLSIGGINDGGYCVFRCGDVGDLLRGSDSIREPLQHGGGDRHHQRDSAVPAPPSLQTAVHHHVPLLARGAQITQHIAFKESFTIIHINTESKCTLFYLTADGSGSTILLRSPGGHQKTSRKNRITQPWFICCLSNCFPFFYIWIM